MQLSNRTFAFMNAGFVQKTIAISLTIVNLSVAGFSYVTASLACLCLMAASGAYAWVILLLSFLYLLQFLLPFPVSDFSVNVFFPVSVAVTACAFAAVGRLVAPGKNAKTVYNVFLSVTVACLGSLLFRDGAAARIAWCIALLAFVFTLRQGVQPAPGTFRRIAVNGCLLLVSLLASLAAMEAGARLFMDLPPPTLTMFRYSPDYVFLLNPNGTTQVEVSVTQKERKLVAHAISSQGLRDKTYGPKAADEIRILMLGDSHTQGHAVAENDCIPRQLERLLAEQERLTKKVTVINAGMAAAGPLQELGMLMEYGLKLQPDLVVLQLFPCNDLDNSLAVCNEHLRAYDEGLEKCLRLIRAWHSTPHQIELWMRQHCHLYRGLAGISGNQHLVLRFLKGLWFFSYEDNSHPKPCEPRQFWMEADLSHWYPELHKAMDIMKKDILSIRDVCRAQGIAFHAYCMPAPLDLIDTFWNSYMAGNKDAALYERRKALRLTQAFLDEQRIPSFSVMEALGAHMDSVYYVHDGHLNELGNKLVAERIRDYLLEHDLAALRPH